MIWIIGRDIPKVGRVYMEGRSKGMAQWCDDIDLARTFAAKTSADKHMADFDLQGAFTLSVVLSPTEKRRSEKFDRIPWGGLHEIYLGPKTAVIYIKMTALIRRTGSYALSKPTLNHVRELAAQQNLGYRVVLEIDKNRRTFHEVDLRGLERLSVQTGHYGDYYLIKQEIFMPEPA